VDERKENILRGIIMASYLDSNDKLDIISYLDYLIDSDKILKALENSGVENWDGYEDSMEIFNKEEEEVNL